jgi:hypothetical protein
MELDIVNDLLDAPDTARKYVWSKYLIRLAIPESGNDGFLHDDIYDGRLTTTKMAGA